MKLINRQRTALALYFVLFCGASVAPAAQRGNNEDFRSDRTCPLWTVRCCQAGQTESFGPAGETAAAREAIKPTDSGSRLSRQQSRIGSWKPDQGDPDLFQDAPQQRASVIWTDRAHLQDRSIRLGHSRPEATRIRADPPRQLSSVIWTDSPIRRAGVIWIDGPFCWA